MRSHACVAVVINVESICHGHAAVVGFRMLVRYPN